MPARNQAPDYKNDMVYVMRRSSDGALKIGCTNNLMSRKRGLEFANLCDMEVIAATKGSLELESELHKRFAAYSIPSKNKKSRRQSEWFTSAAEILEYARNHMDDPVRFMSPKRSASGVQARAQKKTRTSHKNDLVMTLTPCAVVLVNRLSELLKERGITQERFALETGVSIGTVSRWARNNVTRYDKDIIERFCNQLRCRIDELLILEGEYDG